jgi:formate/nitrite transporter FocA (FNT family)
MSSAAVESAKDAKKSPQLILRLEIREALQALDRSLIGLLISGLSGGLDIGFSLFLMAVMHTLTADILSKPVTEILVANMYTVGFIFVVLGRSELFTEQTTLAVLPVISGHASIPALLRLWVAVYVSNLVGAALFAGIASYIGPASGVIDPQSFGVIGRRMVESPTPVMITSGVLAAWLMGLLSWLVAAGRETISQLAVVWLITFSIGLSHLHHAVAGSVEVLAGLFSGQGITWQDYGYFLLWSTLGNILGGVFFVAILKYTQAVHDENS